MAEKNNNFMKSFLTWFIIFFAAYWVMGKFFPQDNKTKIVDTIVVTPVDDSLVLENIVAFKIQNNTSTPITFKSPCGQPGNLQFSRLINGEKHNLSDKYFNECDNQTTLNGFTLEPTAHYTLSPKTLNSKLFNEAGKYVASIKFDIGDETKVIDSDSFTYEEPGFFRTLFRKMISKPLFNLLAFFTSVVPGKSLGASIIALTLLIRLLLFLPNQKAMRSQRKLQTLQPKIEELKKKHGKDQQALAMKTMELYKTEKINPMSSCLPMLLQMPFLIGVYYVVRSGIANYQGDLLYSFNQVDLAHINTQFLGLDLEIPNIIVLPILVAGAQFLAIKLSFAAAKKKQPTKKKKDAPEGVAAQMEQMQKMMLYVMPLMIGFFTATFPAGVGIYWLTSTVFGIFQQKLVNWQLDNEGAVVRRKV